MLGLLGHGQEGAGGGGDSGVGSGGGDSGVGSEDRLRQAYLDSSGGLLLNATSIITGQLNLLYTGNLKLIISQFNTHETD